MKAVIDAVGYILLVPLFWESISEIGSKAQQDDSTGQVDQVRPLDRSDP
ncbi:MAG: hypothetical protein WBA01_00700 [Phormidesmis sp.]